MEHSFDIEIAQEYSLVAAILYRHMQFWIAKNKTNNSNYHDGRTWTYNSVQAFGDQFPYLGKGQIRKGLELLIERGILLRSNYNKRGADRTSWYAFTDEKTALKGLPAHLLKSQMGNQAKTPIFENNKSICENHKALPDQSNPDIPTQINQKVEKNPQEILDLDCKIAEAKKFLREQLSRIFPRFSRREIETFKNIINHLVNSAQQDPRKISWFKDAIEWARIARIEGKKAAGKALFVQTVKERTGYGSNSRLLVGKSQKV